MRVVGVPEQDLVAGLVLLGVAAGGGAGEMTKGADEMGVVGETGQLPRLLDADPLLEQLPGPEDAAVNDILHDGKAGGRQLGATRRKSLLRMASPAVEALRTGATRISRLSRAMVWWMSLPKEPSFLLRSRA